MGGGQTLLPIPFLRQLIRFYGDSHRAHGAELPAGEPGDAGQGAGEVPQDLCRRLHPGGRLRGLPGAGAQEPRHVRAGHGHVLAVRQAAGCAPRRRRLQPPQAAKPEPAKPEAREARAGRPPRSAPTTSASSSPSSPPCRPSSRSCRVNRKARCGGAALRRCAHPDPSRSDPARWRKSLPGVASNGPRCCLRSGWGWRFCTGGPHPGPPCVGLLPSADQDSRLQWGGLGD